MSLTSLESKPRGWVGELVDHLAVQCSAWVAIERGGPILAHGAGPQPCPHSLAQALLSKSIAPLVTAMRGSRPRSVEGLLVRTTDLGEGIRLWLVGTDVAPDPELVRQLAEAVAELDAPVQDEGVAGFLRPVGLRRPGQVAPQSVLTVLQPVDGVPPGRLARAVRAAAPRARVHALDGAVVVADGDPHRLAALPLAQAAGTAVVPAGAPDWVQTVELAAEAAEAARELGTRLGDVTDPRVGLVLVSRAAKRAAAELTRALPSHPVQRLHAYDAANHIDLVASVAAWCELRNTNDAAARLHVHVNTLRYRLRRAEEVAGIDLSSPEQLLALQLALGSA